jgi:aminoglycoside phosphotransferase (APT) family kinase protein
MPESHTPSSNEEHPAWWEKPPEEPLPAEALAWVEQAIGPKARVRVLRSLTGGLVSSVHLLRVEGAGRDSEVVLRRFPGRHRWHETREFVRDEAAVLLVLEGTTLPAPMLIAADADGARSGGLPSLLMKRLPGEIDLAPEDSESWVQQMAEMLARIHRTQLTRRLAERPYSPRPTQPIAQWMHRPDLWQRALKVVQSPPPPVEACLMHGDYQHFNMLWQDGRLTGVVDWGSAATGCPDVDVAHCRLNLAVLFSAERAEGFRIAYEAAAGRRVEPWWDLAELLDYSPDWQQFIPLQVAGRVPVDTEGMTGRVEALIELTLNRL